MRKLIALVLAVTLAGCDDVPAMQRRHAAEAAQARREAFVAAHTDLNEETRKAILAGKVFVGMTEEQALASWGAPSKKNRTILASGVREQWVYSYGYQSLGYLYVENGKLAAIQN